MLYDAGGRLLNVATEFDFLYPDGLGPGGQTPFEATIYSWEPTCFSTVSWGASGQ